MSPFKQALIGIIFIIVFGFYKGLNGVLNKERINNPSDYCKSVNRVLMACLMCVVLLIHLSYMLHWGWLNFLTIKQYANLLIFMPGVVFFIIGLHGIINKKIINNKMFLGFSWQVFIYSIIIFIYLIVYYSMWKGFD
jgi:hypothetical protein